MTAADDRHPGYDPPGRLRELPSWLIAQLARRAHRLVGEALATEGARRQHYVVLTSLAEQGAASQADLGRRLWIDRSDLHAILVELDDEGLIERAPDLRDRRRNVVKLTPAGEAARVRLDERVEGAQSALLAPLSKAERREFRRLLERLGLPAD